MRLGSKEVFKSVVKNRIPYTVMIELTYRCNLNCVHFYATNNSQSTVHSLQSKELSIKEIKRIIDELRNEGTLFVVFTGGEPFLRQDFFSICKYVREKNLCLWIITNGTLITNKEADELKRLNVFRVSISLHGAKKSTHDNITKTPGSYDKTISAINLLRKRNIPVTIKTTLMKDNIAEFEELNKLSKDLDCNWHFDPIIFPKNDGSQKPLSYMIDDVYLEKMFSSKKGISTYHCETSIYDNYLCDAGNTMCCISPYGDVKPCVQLFSVGNLKKDSFHNIWHNSPLLKKFRDTKLENIVGCRDCSLKNWCGWCPSLSYLIHKKFKKVDIMCKIANIRKKAQNKKQTCE